MKPVINSLLNLRAEYITGGDIRPLTSISTKSGSRQGDVSSPASLSPLFGEERRKASSDSQFQRGLRSPVMSGINDVMKSSAHKSTAMTC